MKKYIIIMFAVLAIVTAFGALLRQNKRLKQERNTYRNNTSVLLEDVERYKTKSGQQVVRIGELQLRIDELEKYRTEDEHLIRDMGIKKRELEQITKIQQQTIYDLQGRARDTVYIVAGNSGSVEVGAKCAEYSDEWVDFSCCIFEDNSYKADIKSRDRITYVEHVKYARFLGFLWRTKRIKSRHQSIVNHNPHTKIINAEFITLQK